MDVMAQGIASAIKFIFTISSVAKELAFIETRIAETSRTYGLDPGGDGI